MAEDKIKIFIIPWITFAITNLFFANSTLDGLCQQQAESTFHLITFGYSQDRDDCHKHCCGKPGCYVSIFSGKQCFGVSCRHPALCSTIAKQLGDFQGHRVDRRSTLLHKFNNVTHFNTGDDKMLLQRRGRSSDVEENDHNDYEKSSLPTCSVKYHKSSIPHRKKGFKFRRLSHEADLMGCTNLCCKTEECVLAFTVKNSCYGVMCTLGKNCHSVDDRLPHLRITVAVKRRGIVKKRLLQKKMLSNAGHSSLKAHHKFKSRKRHSHRSHSHNSKIEEFSDVPGQISDKEMGNNFDNDHSSHVTNVMPYFIPQMIHFSKTKHKNFIHKNDSSAKKILLSNDIAEKKNVSLDKSFFFKSDQAEIEPQNLYSNHSSIASIPTAPATTSAHASVPKSINFNTTEAVIRKLSLFTNTSIKSDNTINSSHVAEDVLLNRIEKLEHQLELNMNWEKERNTTGNITEVKHIVKNEKIKEKSASLDMPRDEELEISGFGSGNTYEDTGMEFTLENGTTQHPQTTINSLDHSPKLLHSSRNDYVQGVSQDEGHDLLGIVPKDYMEHLMRIKKNFSVNHMANEMLLKKIENIVDTNSRILDFLHYSQGNASGSNSTKNNSFKVSQEIGKDDINDAHVVETNSKKKIYETKHTVKTQSRNENEIDPVNKNGIVEKDKENNHYKNKFLHPLIHNKTYVQLPLHNSTKLTSWNVHKSETHRDGGDELVKKDPKSTIPNMNRIDKVESTPNRKNVFANSHVKFMHPIISVQNKTKNMGHLQNATKLMKWQIHKPETNAVKSSKNELVEKNSKSTIPSMNRFGEIKATPTRDVIANSHVKFMHPIISNHSKTKNMAHLQNGTKLMKLQIHKPETNAVKSSKNKLVEKNSKSTISSMNRFGEIKTTPTRNVIDNSLVKFMHPIIHNKTKNMAHLQNGTKLMKLQIHKPETNAVKSSKNKLVEKNSKSTISSMNRFGEIKTTPTRNVIDNSLVKFMHPIIHNKSKNVAHLQNGTKLMKLQIHKSETNDVKSSKNKLVEKHSKSTIPSMNRLGEIKTTPTRNKIDNSHVKFMHPIIHNKTKNMAHLQNGTKLMKWQTHQPETNAVKSSKNELVEKNSKSTKYNKAGENEVVEKHSEITAPGMNRFGENKTALSENINADANVNFLHSIMSNHNKTYNKSNLRHGTTTSQKFNRKKVPSLNIAIGDEDNNIIRGNIKTTQTIGIISDNRKTTPRISWIQKHAHINVDHGDNTAATGLKFTNQNMFLIANTIKQRQQSYGKDEKLHKSTIHAGSTIRMTKVPEKTKNNQHVSSSNSSKKIIYPATFVQPEPKNKAFQTAFTNRKLSIPSLKSRQQLQNIGKMNGSTHETFLHRTASGELSDKSYTKMLLMNLSNLPSPSVHKYVPLYLKYLMDQHPSLTNNASTDTYNVQHYVKPIVKVHQKSLKNQSSERIAIKTKISAKSSIKDVANLLVPKKSKSIKEFEANHSLYLHTMTLEKIRPTPVGFKKMIGKSTVSMHAKLPVQSKFKNSKLLDDFFDGNHVESIVSSKKKNGTFNILDTVPQSGTKIGNKENFEKGCTIKLDAQNQIFKFYNEVDVFVRIPQSNIAECTKQCCLSKKCAVAFLEGKICNLVRCKDPSLCRILIPTKRNTRLLFIQTRHNITNVVHDVYCEQQHATGIPWHKTLADTTAVRECPHDALGKVKRVCNIKGNWQQPDFTDCVSPDYLNIYRKAGYLGYNITIPSLLQKLDDITTQTIDNSLIFGGDLVKAVESLYISSKFINERTGLALGHKDLRSITRAVSNLLDETNRDEWRNLKDRKMNPVDPTKLIISLDKMSLYVAGQLPKPMNMKPVITRNILVSVSKIKSATYDENYTFPTNSLRKAWTPRKDSISIPYYVFNHDQPTLVASMSFKTLPLLLPQKRNIKKHVLFTDGFVVNSNVISCAVTPKPKNVGKSFVKIVLQHLKEPSVIESKCVFWDIDAKEISGSWSTDGCSVMSTNKTMTVCQCSHLTHFAVLSNLNEQKISEKEQTKEKAVIAAWLGIPVIVILLLGTLYTCFSWRKSPRRRHVVLMDKGSTLPNKEAIVTHAVSEKYPGSPNRYLHSANYNFGSLELEWEHAWDFMVNSEACVCEEKNVSCHKRSLVCGGGASVPAGSLDVNYSCCMASAHANTLNDVTKYFQISFESTFMDMRKMNNDSVCTDETYRMVKKHIYGENQSEWTERRSGIDNRMMTLSGYTALHKISLHRQRRYMPPSNSSVPPPMIEKDSISSTVHVLGGTYADETTHVIVEKVTSNKHHVDETVHAFLFIFVPYRIVMKSFKFVFMGSTFQEQLIVSLIFTQTLYGSVASHAFFRTRTIYIRRYTDRPERKNKKIICCCQRRHHKNVIIWKRTQDIGASNLSSSTFRDKRWTVLSNENSGTVQMTLPKQLSHLESELVSVRRTILW